MTTLLVFLIACAALAGGVINYLQAKRLRAELEDIRKLLGDDGPADGGTNVGGGGGPGPVK